jgi:glucose/arabinose dehydrogenase
MDFSPDGRLFLCVKDLIPIDEPFVRLQDLSTNATQEILGITLDPDFITNHYVYAYMTSKDSNTGNNFNRVVRFTELEIKATDQKILIENMPTAVKSRKFGGALVFGLDGTVHRYRLYQPN